MSALEHDESQLPELPPRKPESHKGDYGRALLIGGSQGMAGALAMAGLACLRSGAGLVTLATPSVCQPTVAAMEASFMTLPLPGDDEGRMTIAAFETLEPFLDSATAVALGPGLGRSPQLVDLVGRLYRQVKQPMVVDADALDALARQTVSPQAGGPRILTPHPGEFARLIARESIPLDQRESLAANFAQRMGVVLVLKGHRTVITDGTRLALNTTGNPGMATGGSGDTLTGILTALLCQQLEPYDAARLGCHVHGLAGDLAAAELGQVAMIASDLTRYLPTAWQLASSGEG